MEAAAVTARHLLVTRGRRSRASTVGVAFDELGGPVVALCGLTGGAGTTALALLLAQHAAAAGSSPVLVTESEARRGLALRAGRATPHSLRALAARAAEGKTPADAFTELAPGLRLVATAGQVDRVAEASLEGLLGQARAAHGLVVIDCGTTWSPRDSVLEAATHRVWVFPAMPYGLSAARHAIPATGGIAVAVARDPNALVSVRNVRRALARKCVRLVLVPYSAKLARGQGDDDEAVANAIARLAAAIRGTR